MEVNKIQTHETKLKDFFPRYTILPIKIDIFLILVMVVGSVLFYFWLQPEIPIFYSFADPSRQLAPKAMIFLLPSLSITFNIINLALIKLAKALQLERTLIKLFAWSIMIFQLIFVMVLFRIIYLIS